MDSYPRPDGDIGLIGKLIKPHWDVSAGGVDGWVTLFMGVDGEAAGHQAFHHPVHHGHRYAGTATEAAPGASAQLIHALDSDRVFLILRDLPSLASGEEFEIWSIREGVPNSLGTFAKGAEQEKLVSFSADMSDAQNIGISIEPKNGSPTGQPTGPIVLLGTF